MTAPGRAAALGQAAQPHRRAPARRLSRVRRVRGAARPRGSRAPVHQPLPGASARMSLHDLTTPALLVDADALTANLADMAAALPGARCRPHIKAHKTTALARLQAAHHPGFTVATIREAEGLVAAGLGDDLLLANEVLDARRLGAAGCPHHPRDRLRRDARRGRRRRGARGRDRRERRPAALRHRPGEGRRAGRRRRAPPASPSAASWATRATSCCCPTSPNGPGTPRSPWPSCSPRTPTSAASWSPAAAPAPTPSTRGRTRSRPARTR